MQYYSKGLKDLNDPKSVDFDKLNLNEEQKNIRLPLKVDYSYLYPQVDDQGPFGTCFKAGTLIKMSDGSLEKIENVKPGQYVLSAEGNVKMVQASMIREFDGTVYSLTAGGHSRIFEATSEHPVLTKNGYIEIDKLKIGDEIGSFVDTNVNSVKNISLFDFVTSDDIKYIKYGKRKYANGFKNGTLQDGNVIVDVIVPPTYIDLNYETGWIFGSFLAEGNSDVHKIGWTWGSHEENTHVKTLLSYLKNNFNIEPHHQRKTNVYKITIHGKAWAEFFKNMFGKNVYVKKIPKTFFQANDDFKKGLLRGWFDGDASFDSTKIIGKSVSKELSLGMYEIAKSLNLLPRIGWHKPVLNRHAKTRKNYYTVTVTNPEYVGKDISKIWTGYREQNYNWLKIRKIDSCKFKGLVYNLQIADDNSYIAEGIGVHNCVAFATKKVLEFYFHKRQHKNILVSADGIYSAAKSIYYPNDKSDNGLNVSDGLNVLKQFYVLDKDFPYDTSDFNTCLRPIPDNIKNKDFEIKGFVTVNPDPASMKLALFHAGVLVIGINWQQEWQSPDNKGRLQGQGTTPEGGHCIAIVGYDDNFVNIDGTSGAFHLVNNWSENWGLRGHAFLPYNSVTYPSDVYTVQI